MLNTQKVNTKCHAIGQREPHRNGTLVVTHAVTGMSRHIKEQVTKRVLKTGLSGIMFLCVVTSPVYADERLTRAGDFFYHFSQAGAVAYTYDQHGFDGAASCAVSSLANNFTTRFLKKAIDQPRPNGGSGGMPSGHTSRVASSFGCLLGQEGLTTPTLFLGAATAVTAYSRVEGDFHTVEQVLAGAALGTAIGYLGTQHLYVSPTEVHVTVPLSGPVTSGAAVSIDARKALIDFANDR